MYCKNTAKIKRDYLCFPKQHNAIVICTGQYWVLRQKTEFYKRCSTQTLTELLRVHPLLASSRILSKSTAHTYHSIYTMLTQKKLYNLCCV